MVDLRADYGASLMPTTPRCCRSGLSSSLGRASPKSPTEALQPEAVPAAADTLARRPPSAGRLPQFPADRGDRRASLPLGGAVFAAKVQFERPSDLDQARAITLERGVSLSAIADQLQKDGIIAIEVAVRRRRAAQPPAGGAEGRRIPDPGARLDARHHGSDGVGQGHPLLRHHPRGPDQRADRRAAEAPRTFSKATSPRCRRKARCCRRPTSSRAATRARASRPHAARARPRARRHLGAPRAGPAGHDAGRTGGAGVDRREGDGARRRAQPRRGGVHQSPAPQHAPAVGPDGDLRPVQGRREAGRVRADRRADLEKQSPYNTYVIDGLPPGPIANPGRASLEAVANPSRTRDLFFVADGSGGHAFAETYEEHLQNVARWRDISANSGAAIAGGNAAGQRAAGSTTQPAPRTAIAKPPARPTASTSRWR